MTTTEHDHEAPVLPYGTGPDANSGFAAGVETSKERARRDDADGTTSYRQARVLALLAGTAEGRRNMFVGREQGLTWKELGTLTEWHHGQASGVLSNLHKVDKIARLTEKRNRCYVYVLPEHVNGRDTQEQGRRARQPEDQIAVDVVRAEARIARAVALHEGLHRCTGGGWWVGNDTEYKGSIAQQGYCETHRVLTGTES